MTSDRAGSTRKITIATQSTTTGITFGSSSRGMRALTPKPKPTVALLPSLNISMAREFQCKLPRPIDEPLKANSLNSLIITSQFGDTLIAFANGAP